MLSLAIASSRWHVWQEPDTYLSNYDILKIKLNIIFRFPEDPVFASGPRVSAWQRGPAQVQEQVDLLLEIETQLLCVRRLPLLLQWDT